MGCDIHVMVEAKDFYVPKTGWINVDNWKYNPFYGVEESDSEPEMLVQPIYDGRNYEAFAFLAGARNYNNVTSFGFDRGFPNDADVPTQKEYDRCGIDAHTPGYATLAELKEKIKYAPPYVCCLLPLKESIEERKREVFCIYRKEDDDGSCDDKIRIVFWFDN